MKTLNERLDLIKPKILSKDFRFGRGLGNEINFWIFDYDAEDEMAVRSYINFLRENITTEHEHTRIMVFDLFELMVDYLDEKNYLDKTLEMERAKKSGYVINTIKKTLRATMPDDVLANRIADDINPDTDIIFICGVGKAWPVIRSHTILNNLHIRIETAPLVLFFPGYYDAELRLFGEITDDNYYRAHRLVER